MSTLKTAVDIINESSLPIVMDLNTDEQFNNVVALMELYASQYRSPSTPDFLEALKSEWIKHFGSLNDNHERDGYFMVGFVSEVLKQFRPSTVEKESYTKEQMNEAFEAGVDAIDYDELEGFTRNASFDDFLKTLPS